MLGTIFMVVVLGFIFGVVGLRDYTRHKNYGALERRSEIDSKCFDQIIDQYLKTDAPQKRQSETQDILDLTPPPRKVSQF